MKDLYQEMLNCDSKCMLLGFAQMALSILDKNDPEIERFKAILKTNSLYEMHALCAEGMGNISTAAEIRKQGAVRANRLKGLRDFLRDLFVV